MRSELGFLRPIPERESSNRVQLSRGRLCDKLRAERTDYFRSAVSAVGSGRSPASSAFHLLRFTDD